MARWLAISCCILLVTTACGSRLTNEEILAQNTVQGTTAAGGSEGTDQVGVGTSGVGTSGVGTSSDGKPASDGNPASVGQPGTGVAGAAGGGADIGGGAGGGRSGGPGSSESSGGGEASQRGQSSAKAPITIAFVGYLSGINGPNAGPARDVMVAWEKMVNARGGINGHPVKLLIGDDGGNESRSVSLVRDFVENKGAIAIVNYAGTAEKAVGDYAKRKSVPIVSVLTGMWDDNPMVFLAGANLEGLSWGGARVLKNAGVTKVASLFCVEAVQCEQTNDLFVRYAKEEGLEVVYKGRISVTQPDYTAECIQARNAGAEAVLPIASSDSAVRLAQSCSRQGYEPIWALSRTDDPMAKIEALDGSIAFPVSFPWFLRSGSPAVDEYVQALQTYAPSRLTDGNGNQAVAWAGAKLFEQAAANVSDQPTSQDILNGLWAMKGETLRGLTSGSLARTFNRGQVTPTTFCVFDIRIRGGRWVAPDGLTPVCR
jgi:branched-chain amino acid transport system substrate-binding protein